MSDCLIGLEVVGKMGQGKDWRLLLGQGVVRAPSGDARGRRLTVAIGED